MSKDVFCNKSSFSHNIIYESEHCYLLMDEFPATVGHFLVITKKHYNYLADLSGQELSDLINMVSRGISLLEEMFDTVDYNIVYCEGKKAGQSIEHVHWHIVPRFPNDDIIINLNENQSKEYYQKIKGKFIKKLNL